MPKFFKAGHDWWEDGWMDLNTGQFWMIMHVEAAKYFGEVSPAYGILTAENMARNTLECFRSMCLDGPVKLQTLKNTLLHVDSNGW